MQSVVQVGADLNGGTRDRYFAQAVIAVAQSCGLRKNDCVRCCDMDKRPGKDGAIGNHESAFVDRFQKPKHFFFFLWSFKLFFFLKGHATVIRSEIFAQLQLPIFSPS